MSSFYELKAYFVVNDSLEVVFDFMLFFFRLSPDHRFLGSGSLPEPDRTQTLNQGRVATSAGPEVITRWENPRLIVLEQFSAPFLKRQTIEIIRLDGASKVIWIWRYEARNLLERVFIALHRRNLDKVKSMHQAAADQLRAEFDNRNESGVGEYFEAFRNELHHTQT